MPYESKYDLPMHKIALGSAAHEVAVDVYRSLVIDGSVPGEHLSTVAQRCL